MDNTVELKQCYFRQLQSHAKLLIERQGHARVMLQASREKNATACHGQ